MTPELAAEVIDDVVPRVEQIRGLRFRNPVPVEVVDDDAAREHLLKRIDTFDMRDQLAYTQRAYALLGLIPEGADLLELSLGALREQAGGFYDPETGSFYLLDDMPATAVSVLTAHELTHALEDQHFDLDARLAAVADDDDRSFALGAVHEGSATLVMAVYSAQAVLRGDLSAEQLQAFETELGSTAGLEQLPPVLVRQLVGPYVLGMTFLTRGSPAAAAMSGFPVEDVARVFRDTPTSSEQILHPEKYWDPERRDEPRPVRTGPAGERLGKRWAKTGEGVLGEISLAVLTAEDASTDPMALLIGEASWTNAAASGWGGDRWELWQRGKKAAVVLSTVWDSERDAQEFETAIRRERFHVRRARDRVAVVAGDVGGRAGQVLDALLVEPAPGTGASGASETPRLRRVPETDTVKGTRSRPEKE